MTEISNFKAWRYKTHAKEYLIYPNNVSEQLSIGKTAFTNGELYTIVTNKQAKGKKAVFS